MADKLFAIVFSGRIAEGANGAQVRLNLAKLFKVNADKIDAMFFGRPVIIKNNLIAAKARSYQTALAKAGAIVELIEAAGNTSAASAAGTPASSKATSGANTAEPPPPPVAPNLTIAEAGVTILEHVPTPPANFDTTHFGLARIGADLVPYVVVPPANFDTKTWHSRRPARNWWNLNKWHPLISTTAHFR